MTDKEAAHKYRLMQAIALLSWQMALEAGGGDGDDPVPQYDRDESPVDQAKVYFARARANPKFATRCGELEAQLEGLLSPA